MAETAIDSAAAAATPTSTLTKKKNVRLALVGAGFRGREMTARLLARHPEFELVVLVDDHFPEDNNYPNVDGTHLHPTVHFPEHMKFQQIPHLSYSQFFSAESAFAPAIDAVIVASVNNLHAQHIEPLLTAGKYVFCEKPLVTKFPDALIDLVIDAKDRLCTGFVLRHSAFYRAIYDHLHADAIGKVTSGHVTDFLHHGHGALIFASDWRSSTEKSGGHVVEKLVHVIDLLTWFLHTSLSHVVAMRGPDTWCTDTLPDAQTLVERTENVKLFDAYAFFRSRNPFFPNVDAECDRVVASSGHLLMQFYGGAVINLHFNTFCPNSEREVHFIGTLGELHAVSNATETYIKIVKRGVGKKSCSGQPSEENVYRFEPVGCHGGGDDPIVDAFARTVLKGAPPQPPIDDVLRTMWATLAAQEAMTRCVN